MPPPKTPKEVRQLLGLVRYYRKFVPKFADIARPLTNLTKQDVKFEWSEKCQKTFQLLKDMLLKEPVLKYPDPSKPYILFTDASKYAWACVLTQEYEHEFDGKVRKILHPITYVLLCLRVQNQRKKWNFPLNFQTVAYPELLLKGLSFRVTE